MCWRNVASDDLMHELRIKLRIKFTFVFLLSRAGGLHLKLYHKLQRDVFVVL